MPAIDLARLRKQTARLADFYFLPDEFVRQLRSLLDSYVNYTARRRPAAASGSGLHTYRTPQAILNQIELELERLVSEDRNSQQSLALADALWDDASLEGRVLAAYLLGRMKPQERRLVARLTAWTAQTRDTDLRRKLLDDALVRARREQSGVFLDLLGEWLRPERQQLWSNALQAAVSAVKDDAFLAQPALLEVLRPTLRAAPSEVQLDIEELILALHKKIPTETAYFVTQIIASSNSPTTRVTFRRMLPSLPSELRDEIREVMRSGPPAG
jgi:hypothetical protein